MNNPKGCHITLRFEALENGVRNFLHPTLAPRKVRHDSLGISLFMTILANHSWATM